MGLSDSAGNTAGYETTDGALMVTDFFDDLIMLSDYPNSCQYAYTGVPWAQPHVDEIKYDFASAAASPASALPVDGGKVTLYGVGFAKSPWMKCVVVPPGAETSSARDPTSYDYGYENNNPSPKTAFMPQPHDLDATDAIVWSDAKAFFGAWPNSPRFHYKFKEEYVAMWDETLLDQQYGEITPFLTDTLDPFSDDFIVGYWEAVTCEVSEKRNEKKRVRRVSVTRLDTAAFVFLSEIQSRN
eukprot:9477202-Pyramimonas_sp.AAC.1